jgi:protein-disulfide isomerase
MNINSETKFFIGIIIVTIIILFGAVLYYSKPEKPVSNDLLIRNDSWSTGSANSKVTLVEFSDFECPACINVHKIVKDLIDKYSKEIKFVYRHYPLDIHPNARKAAMAVEAAGLQGKFWEMQDGLFNLQGQLEESNIQKIVDNLKLDVNRFNEDLKSSTVSNKIQNDVNDGNLLKIDQTPTFYINGIKIKLTNYKDLEKEIEKILGK